MDFYSEYFPDSFADERLLSGVSDLIQLTQRETCARWGTPHLPTNENELVYVATPLSIGRTPIYGLRIQPSRGETGWHLWQDHRGGVMPDTFRAVPMMDFVERLLPIARYFGLPVGWRFAASATTERVWRDEFGLRRYLAHRRRNARAA